VTTKRDLHASSASKSATHDSPRLAEVTGFDPKWVRVLPKSSSQGKDAAR